MQTPPESCQKQDFNSGVSAAPQGTSPTPKHADTQNKMLQLACTDPTLYPVKTETRYIRFVVLMVHSTGTEQQLMS